MERTTALNPEPPAPLGTIERTLRRLVEGAGAHVVYGQAVEAGDVRVIPASESLVVTGFGMGAGSGGEDGQPGGSGAGGGGGGSSLSRPVAVIIVSPSGVQVQPVLDVSKIGLAAITTLGVIFVTAAKLLAATRQSS